MEKAGGVPKGVKEEPILNQKRSLRGSGGQKKPQIPDLEHMPEEKDLSPEQRQQMQQLKKYADRYKNKSEGEIMQEIGAMAAKSKASGKLTDQQIDSFKSKLAPMLDAEQRKKLENIVNQIKKK